jgi:ABC-2 type transport system ATP-binding protein
VSEAVYCDRVAVMRRGRLLAVDTPENLKRKAMGGEIIQMVLEDPNRVREAVSILSRYEPVKAVRTLSDQPGYLQVTVDDAGEWMPEVLNVLEDPDGPAITVSSAGELPVSYDDVFIRIMQQEDANEQYQSA